MSTIVNEYKIVTDITREYKVVHTDFDHIIIAFATQSTAMKVRNALRKFNDDTKATIRKGKAKRYWYIKFNFVTAPI